MTGTGESTDDLTARRAELIAARLRALNERPHRGAGHDDPPPDPDGAGPVVNDTAYRGAAPYHGAMRPGPGARPLNFKYPVTWSLRRPEARGVPDDGFPPEVGMPVPVPPPIVIADGPPVVGPELHDEAAVPPRRTVPARGSDPDATQAIGLHRAADPPTPRAPGRVRGIARVLPWNWFRA